MSERPGNSRSFKAILSGVSTQENRMCVLQATGVIHAAMDRNPHGDEGSLPRDI